MPRYSYAVPVFRELGIRPLLSIAFMKIFLRAVFCMYFSFPGCDDQYNQDADPASARLKQ